MQPCEAAYLSAVRPAEQKLISPPPVTVLVLCATHQLGLPPTPLTLVHSPSYLRAMRKVYSVLPHVKVEPLLFSSEDISGERLLSMMKVDETTRMSARKMEAVN